MPTPSSDVHLTQQTERLQRGEGAGAGAGRVADASDTGGDSETLRFRAPTLEAAIALAETSLGSRVRVVAANRIRRGGIGGFFASDLGVEVTVALDDETMEDALARLVAESDADDRAQWTSTPTRTPGPAGAADAAGAIGAADAHALLESFAAIAARTGAIEPSSPAIDRRSLSSEPAAAPRDHDSVPHTVNPVLAEVLAAIMEEAAQAQQTQAQAQAQAQPASVDEAEYTPEPAPPIIARRLHAPGGPVPRAVAVPVAPVAPVAAEATEVAAAGIFDTGRRPVYTTPPTMVRVEQIIEELSAITAAPVFSAERTKPRVPRPRFGDREHTPADPDADPDAEPIEAARPIEMERPIDRPKVLPTLPPRASEIARAASAASAASHARLLHSPEPRLAVEQVQQVQQVELPEQIEQIEQIEQVEQVEHVEQPEHEVLAVDVVVDDGVGSSSASGTSTRRLQVPARHSTTSVAAAGTGSTQAPSRRHVELAVAATDQLIESLTREEGVKRLSVRVVLRTADHREVETEAEWEAE